MALPVILEACQPCLLACCLSCLPHSLTVNPTTLLAHLTESSAHYVPSSCTHGKAEVHRSDTFTRHQTSSACNIVSRGITTATPPPTSKHTLDPPHPLLTLDARDRPLLTPPCLPRKPAPITTPTAHPPTTAVRSRVSHCCTSSRSLKREGTIGGRSRAEPTFPREGYGRLDRDEHREDGGGR